MFIIITLINSTNVIKIQDISIFIIIGILNGANSLIEEIKIKQIPPTINIEIWEKPLYAIYINTYKLPPTRNKVKYSRKLLKLDKLYTT